MVNFLFLFLVLLSLAYLINYFLIHSILGYKWRLFVAPGVIFHELCHAVACKLTGAKIAKISFFDKDGGSVTHTPPLIPILGPILISTAPLVLGILVFYFLAMKINLEKNLDFSSIYFNLKAVFLSINFAKWQNILILYLLVSIAVTMTPSRKDFTNMLIPLVLLTAAFYAIVKYTNINYGHFDYFLNKLSLVLNTAVFILIVFFAASLLIHFISKFILKRA